MADCTCKVTRLPDGRRTRNRRGHQFGSHHEPSCPMWEDPTRVPKHAQRLFDEAQTDTDVKRAILNEDLLNEYCD